VSVERPILFSDPMVRAILAGQKTQTRRVMRLEPDKHGQRYFYGRGHAVIVHPTLGPLWRPHGGAESQPMPAEKLAAFGPYGAPGDRLWVREAWCPRSNGALFMEKVQRSFFRATDGDGDMPKPRGWRWRPSIHMPRWACRLVLEVTGVRVERLNDITEDDVRAEGVTGDFRDFASLWDSINGSGAWSSKGFV